MWQYFFIYPLQMSPPACDALGVKTADKDLFLEYLKTLSISDVTKNLFSGSSLFNNKKKLVPWGLLNTTLAYVYNCDWSQISDAHFRNACQVVNLKAERETQENGQQF